VDSLSLQCLGALSLILDLANGFGEDKSLLCAAFALRLAQEEGMGEPAQRAVWLAALLRHLGCTAFASTEASLVSDDIELRRQLQEGDASRRADVFRAILAASSGPLEGAGALARVATVGTALREVWVREACEAAHLLSEQLALGPEVSLALDEVFERWDGTGSPAGRAGDALSPVGRVAQLAHLAVLRWLTGGQAAAAEALAAQSGRSLDPALVRRALPLLGELGSLDARALCPPPGPPIELQAVVEGFGDFADLRTPIKHGHSRAVAALAGEAAVVLGLAASERQEVVWAAHLHDLGEVALPTALWTARRELRASERERIRLHPYLTERALAQAPGLSAVARIAGAHHERLDGTGYHRGAPAHSLPRGARLLAVADTWSALTSPRPHRPALSPKAARAALQQMVVAGQLDADCAEVVLVAAGERRHAALPGTAALTAREVEVLRELAQGRTNKEIAVALGISARTVQNHTLHIYEKLGVSTRAGAALLAARAGLLA
jgi:HD-GYP domain-containing protein (c-di-GMP phosphodiesterase class II)